MEDLTCPCGAYVYRFESGSHDKSESEASSLVDYQEPMPGPNRPETRNTEVMHNGHQVEEKLWKLTISPAEAMLQSTGRPSVSATSGGN